VYLLLRSLRQMADKVRVYDLCLLPGDGIGVPVAEETVRLLKTFDDMNINWHHGDIGWKFWCTEANALPDRTIELIKKYPVGLFGAITSKPKAAADAELDPKLREKKPVYYSPIVTLRQRFDLDICMRPCKSFHGNPLNFVRRSATGGIEEPKIDIVVFRQNTECLYGGVEWTNPPDQVYDALKTHPRFKIFEQHPKAELAITSRIFSKKYTTRIVRAAFEHAKKYGYKSVSVLEKPNICRETSGMMLSIAHQMAKLEEFKGIAAYDQNIDAAMMYMTKNPEDLGVVVSGNMFGDICSDGFAGLVGGLGFAASGNIGEKTAIFEPTHGSAPKYADFKTQIVNPMATFLCGAMMLDFLNERKNATIIREAIADVVQEGKVRSYDMMRMKGAEDVVNKGAASTTQMTDAVIDKVKAILKDKKH